MQNFSCQRLLMRSLGIRSVGTADKASSVCVRTRDGEVVEPWQCLERETGKTI
jgi:hypothetical protein